MRLFILALIVLFIWTIIMDLAVQTMRKSKKKKGED